MWMIKFITIYITFAYLLGSIPWGILFTRMFTGQDIRKAGSCNIGATNVRRTAGTLPAVLTLAGDVLKGAVPVYFALHFPLQPDLSLEARHTMAAVTALAAFLGHLYPIFLGFRDGGKGVATAGGGLLVLCPSALMISIAVFLTAALWSNYASVGSLTAALIMPPAVWFFSPFPITLLTMIIISGCIIVRHKDNIRRLRQGTESVIRRPKTEDN